MIIGDEILSGRRQDKHIAHFMNYILQRGMHLSVSEFVQDDSDAMAET